MSNKGKVFIYIIGIVFFLLLVFNFWGCKNENKIVAEVEGQKITQEELNKELNAQYGMEVLQSLIDQKLIEL
ncbi:MAG: SurA N-terminal domain-containing protein, partial [bacterium]